jgi:serine/threonine-protein kinase
MGVVYRARQIHLDRVVALKMIRDGGLAGPEEERRFRAEAAAVARLQHPHVVQVYEVGEFEGRPFFSLEYVDGGSLAERVRGTPQPPRAAAQTVATLARAAHAAHERGIVHRDLKPANVLLTADGSPKITDFGLAKRLGSASAHTQSGAILGTPSYMAPEQAEGRSRVIGPPADIYALGAILYELLTGRPPFLGTTVLDTLQQAIGQEPVPPRRLQPTVPRDLETICLKCLQKEPRKRYATAGALAEDLRRYLAGEPIEARPVGRLERVAKWVRRRPAAAALVGVSVLAAGALLAQGLWSYREVRAERDRAEENFREAEDNFRTARKAVRELLTEVAQEQLAYEPGLELKRKVLLEKALGFYKGFLAKKGTDPRVRLETAEGYHLVGEIQRLLEQHEAAQAAYAQAITLLTALAEQYPDDPIPRQLLATSHNFLGESLRQSSRLADAAAAYDRARQIQEQLIADAPAEPDYRQELARTHYNRGILYKETNRPAESKRALAEAAALLKPLVAAYPAVPAYRQHLARSYLNLDPSAGTPAEVRETEQRYREAIALLRDLVAAEPRKPDYRHELGATYHNLGELLQGRGCPDEAAAAQRQAVALFGRLAADFPSVPVYRHELAMAHISLGCALQRDPRLAAAEWERALQLLQALCSEFPQELQYRGRRGIVQGNLGWYWRQQKDPARARACLEQGIADLGAALASNRHQGHFLRALYSQHLMLAHAALDQGDHATAARVAQRLPDFHSNRADGLYLAACFLGRCIALAGQDAATRQYADRAMALLREAIAQGYKDLGRLRNERDLEPLQQRDDFQTMVEGGARPGAR